MPILRYCSIGRIILLDLTIAMDGFISGLLLVYVRSWQIDAKDGALGSYSLRYLLLYLIFEAI